MPLTQVVKTQIHLALDLVVGGAGNADTPWVGLPLDARRKIHTVPEHVIAIDDDVAEVDSDAKHHPLFRHIGDGT